MMVINMISGIEGNRLLQETTTTIIDSGITPNTIDKIDLTDKRDFISKIDTANQITETMVVVIGTTINKDITTAENETLRRVALAGVGAVMI